MTFPNLTINSLLLTRSLKNNTVNIFCVLYVYLHIFYAFMMDLFLTYSLFLGCKIHLQVFSSCHKSQKVFSIYLLKKNLHISSVQFSRSAVSSSLGPHGLYSSWNSSGQHTGVGSLSLLQGLFPTQGLNPGLPHCR